ncbi:MAG: hypothetical protein D3909_13850 [Candidatus Electrothrix sp. ATG1]|nr:hypothetical protein [Candidatus Electrothrix sp. ATG1]
MTSDSTKQSIIQDWEELGFFYDVDDKKKEWIFIGSLYGLSKFPQLLADYVADYRNEMLSEHEHYGPYMYLKIVTLENAEIGRRHIGGPLESLANLKRVFEKKLANAKIGDTLVIGPEFCDTPKYSIKILVKKDNFHPAEEDSGLKEYIQKTNCL